MKRTTTFLVLILIFITTNLSAQKQVLITDFYVTANTTEFDVSKKQAQNFISQNKCIILNQTESSNELTIEFLLQKEKFNDFEAILPSLGHISNRKLTTVRETNKVKETEREIQYLKQRKEAYEKELATITNKEDKYYDFWTEVRHIEAQIHDNENILDRAETSDDFMIYLTIVDETYDLSDYNIDWVNMPGAQFDYLFIENPNFGVSANEYMGYSLKYMFTRGKSYVNLGTQKEYRVSESTTSAQDSTRFKELFILGFGQDFYTRYFGRGKNKFFNLYSGYNIGGLYATSDSGSDMFAYIKPSFGIELFKNKYILLDNRVEYFIPLKYNRELRGLMYSASFNFVF